jgi:molybdopterin synthase sulfur carrier subunit
MAMTRLRIRYFAWIRTRVGTGSETVEAPDTVRDVAGLMDWLEGRSPGHARAFARREAVRIAINQDYVDSDHPVAEGDEVAFFPPVTGG